MDFIQAWDVFDIGDVVEIQLPDIKAEVGSAVWNSHNFTGELVAKTATAPRSMHFNLPADDNGSIIGFIIEEGRGHQFKGIMWNETPALAETAALQELEDAADATSFNTVKSLRRQVAIMQAWNEVTLLKMHQSMNLLTALDTAERRKRFPSLMALVATSGATLAAVATAVENRYWDAVRKNALWEAKLVVAEDAVRAATTVEAKKTAAQNVSWDE